MDLTLTRYFNSSFNGDRKEISSSYKSATNAVESVSVGLYPHSFRNCCRFLARSLKKPLAVNSLSRCVEIKTIRLSLSDITYPSETVYDSFKSSAERRISPPPSYTSLNLPPSPEEEEDDDFRDLSRSILSSFSNASITLSILPFTLGAIFFLINSMLGTIGNLFSKRLNSFTSSVSS